MFGQIHMLQSMPPGNLNRDDTGQPKKCLFGGVTRGRISSQCLKRNIRHSPQFKEAFGEDMLLVAVFSPPKQRFERLKKRGETWDMDKWEDFVWRERPVRVGERGSGGVR